VIICHPDDFKPMLIQLLSESVSLFVLDCSFLLFSD
jgi:hypothetical protein